MKKFIIAFICLLCVLKLNAQINNSDTNNVVFQPWFEVTKMNGTKYVAKIISDDGREVLLDTKNLGKIFIPKSEIKSIIKIENEKNIIQGEYRSEGPFTTRYYLTTNALPVKKGENYSLIHLWGPEMHLAVTNSTSVGVMSTWIGSPLAFAIKQNIKTKNEKLNFSIGSIVGTMGYLNQFRGYGALLFGNVTYGSRMSNITFSAGVSNFKSGFNRNYSVDIKYVDPANMFTYYYSTSVRYMRNPNFSSLFSVSGITKMSSTASFIFDAIFSASKITVPSKIQTNIDLTNWYFQNIENPDLESFMRYTIVLMPSIRFQTSEKTAFQFSLGGVVSLDKRNNVSFPFPMCSWFNKF